VVIDEGDALIGAEAVGDADHVILGTREGQSIRFDGAQVRPMGRQSRGVRGIEVRREEGGDDAVVSLAVAPAETEDTLLTVSERGFGKRTALAEYRPQNRGGRGLLTMKANERNGKVVDIRRVAAEDHLMLITDGGKLIRLAASTIPTVGRNTMGVRLIRLAENERVVAVERIADKESASGDLAEPPPATIIPPTDEDDDNGADA
jgi:DNA gyrase subunit A